MPRENPIEETQATKNEMRCGLTRRFMVMVYDAIVVIALMMLLTSVVLLVHPDRLTAGKDILYTALLLMVWFTYLAWCWQHGGMTLGMRAWKVKLVADSDTGMSWRLSFMRWACSLLSALALGAGFFWSLIDKEKRTWHDRLSGSRLIKAF